MAPDLIHYFLFALFPVALAYAALSDLLTMTIPNRLVLAVVVLFVAMAPLTPMGWSGFAWHFVAGAIILVIGFTCFAFGWIGGGDAKFAAAVALFLGIENALAYVALASVLGGALTMALLAFRQVPVPEPIFRQPWVQRLHNAKTGVPYGIALSAAAAFIYPASIWAGLVGG